MSLSAMLPLSSVCIGVITIVEERVGERPLDWSDVMLLDAVLGRLRLEAKDLRGSDCLESMGLDANVLASLLSLELS